MVGIAFVAVVLCILFQSNTFGRKKSELIIEEVVRLATYIDETDFLIEDEPPKEVIRDYIDYFKKREISLEKLKEMLKIAIQEMDVEAQKQLLEQLKEYKK